MGERLVVVLWVRSRHRGQVYGEADDFIMIYKAVKISDMLKKNPQAIFLCSAFSGCPATLGSQGNKLWKEYSPGGIWCCASRYREESLVLCVQLSLGSPITQKGSKHSLMVQKNHEHWMMNLINPNISQTPDGGDSGNLKQQEETNWGEACWPGDKGQALWETPRAVYLGRTQLCSKSR